MRFELRIRATLQLMLAALITAWIVMGLAWLRAQHPTPWLSAPTTQWELATGLAALLVVVAPEVLRVLEQRSGWTDPFPVRSSFPRTLRLARLLGLACGLWGGFALMS
jgi:hypothetical protein